MRARVSVSIALVVVSTKRFDNERVSPLLENLCVSPVWDVVYPLRIVTPEPWSCISPLDVTSLASTCVVPVAPKVTEPKRLPMTLPLATLLLAS